MHPAGDFHNNNYEYQSGCPRDSAGAARKRSVQAFLNSGCMPRFAAHIDVLNLLLSEMNVEGNCNAEFDCNRRQKLGYK